ncbi:response regulator [Paenibacillus sedimenti]|uniref:Response regulator n=1 Tax=Paenibacillus sedimenti TaxID=2770274 RepID=A0A926KVI1_9BACL|nr:response regulator [Paenibacillus sedimenti]MBD0382958.1 response regulator [Paenibacillus sedimenti]
MRKIRMILADDEPVILRGLKIIVNWEELGIEIVGEAYDGKQLIDLIEAYEPDLIVSDICMPGFSGIEVLKQIEMTKKAAKVIFISAYKEFSYAQDALKYGALDYLVKPVNTLQLEQVVTKAVSLIREESEEERNREMLVHYEKKKRDDTIEELLDRLTDGDVAAAHSLQESGILEQTSYVTVCMGEWNHIPDDTGRWQERERKLIEFAIANIMVEIVTESGQGFFFRKGRVYCVLVQHDRLETPIELANELHDKVKTYLKLNLTINVGSPVASIKEAAQSYKDALEASKWNYFSNTNRVIPYQPAHPDPAARMRLAELQLELFRDITSPTGRSPSEIMRELLVTMREFASGSKHAAVSAVYSTIIMLQQELKGVGIATQLSNDKLPPVLEQLSVFDSFAELEDFVLELIDEIHKQVKAKTGNKELMLLLQVKQHIEEHYADNITLESMAALVFMNSYYFSSFFKKHTGENFKQYLTEVRMKHALRLLVMTDLMVYEIAEKVGYNNARHFSEMFKKMYGKLPQEYKQSMKT